MTAPGLATEFADADESVGLQLWRVTNAWQAAMRRTLRPLGLSHVQFVLLASLTWLDGDGPVTQKALADHARTDPMMTSQVLRALERQKLVERRVHPTDGRAKVLAVTDAGRDLANRAVVAVESCDREFFSALGAGGAEFARMLGVLGARQPA